MDLTGKRIGNYVAKAELGSGGMGVVYLCEHPLIRRRAAAKVLHEELAASEEIARRLFAEAKAANEIDSEHIIEVLDFGRIEDGGRELVYLLMEFLEGEGLGNRLWRTGLTIEESLHIVRQCCEALEASHKVGIVHRDLKPENIFLLDRRGDPNFVKILDFGIAKVSGSPSTKTRTGVLLGTPAYMSPEQCRGSGAVDARADVYSLGIVLYELTTGDVPFNGNGYGQVLLSQMTERPRPPTSINKDLPSAVEAIILRTLEKDPDARFQSMAELAQAIVGVQGQLDLGPPVQQIPRKGLHQRQTVVPNRPSRPVVDGVLAQIAPTPVDAALSARMAVESEGAPTQQMGVVDPAAIGTLGTLPGVSPDGDGPATVLDQRLPTAVMRAQAEFHGASTVAVEAPQRSEPATEMRRDGAGNLTTGPQGMLAPRVAPPAVLTVVTGAAAPGIATVVRAAPLPERARPTSEIDEAVLFPRTGRKVLLAAIALAAIALVLAIVFRR